MKRRTTFRPMVILSLEAFAGSFDSAPKGVHTSDYYLSRIKKEDFDPIKEGLREEEDQAAFEKAIENMATPSETKTNGWVPYTVR